MRGIGRIDHDAPVRGDVPGEEVDADEHERDDDDS